MYHGEEAIIQGEFIGIQSVAPMVSKKAVMRKTGNDSRFSCAALQRTFVRAQRTVLRCYDKGVA